MQPKSPLPRLDVTYSVCFHIVHDFYQYLLPLFLFPLYPMALSISQQFPSKKNVIDNSAQTVTVIRVHVPLLCFI